MKYILINQKVLLNTRSKDRTQEYTMTFTRLVQHQSIEKAKQVK